MWFLAMHAHAAGLDADGLSLSPLDGSAAQPSMLRTAPRLQRMQVAIGLRTALAVRPLVRSTGSSEEALVPLAALAYVQGVGMVTPWLGFSASVPVRLYGGAAGPAIGDARAAVWARPVHTRSTSLGIDLGLVLPLGAVEAFSGGGVWAPRLGAALAWHGPLRVDVGAGAAYEGSTAVTPGRGGVVLDGGLGVGLERGRFGVGVSARVAAPLASEVRRRRGVGAEAGLHADARVTDRVRVSALGSRALLDAAGFPVWRVGLGVTAELGRREEATETLTGERVVTIVDPDGTPVRGAVVHLDDAVTTDASGQLSLVWERAHRGARISAPGLRDGRLTASKEFVQLDWAPTLVRVEIRSETGEPVDVQVSLQGGGGSFVATSDHRREAPLLPGSYTLSVAAEGFGTQRRELRVHPRRVDPIDLEVVLAARRGDGVLEMEISDPQGEHIEGAEVRLDGVAMGTAGSGKVAFEGLVEDKITLAVESPYFENYETEVDLSKGPGFVEVNPYYAPGTVRVVARGPQGPVPDGTLFLAGPRSLPPMSLTPLGERLIRLAEGTWDGMLSSPALGLQERRIRVDADSPVPIEVTFDLQPEVEGVADLVVQVRDRDGRELDGVRVDLDGASVGTTGSGGSLRLIGLEAGPVELAVSGDALEPLSRGLVLREGVQEAVLAMDWDPGTVEVRARTPRGPADALVSFDGPSPYESGRLGPSGERLFVEVPRGEWEVVASHEEGMEVAITVVEEADPHLVQVDIRLGDEGGDAELGVQVTDSGGAPVEGAVLWIDDVQLATTSSGGGVRVSGLVAGGRSLRVEAPWFEPMQRAVVLPSDERVRLSYRRGVLDLQVTANGAPVSDAVVFFDGPRAVDALTLGPGGAGRTWLGAGEWTLLVSSPSAGLAEHTVQLGGRRPVLERIELASDPSVLVRVMDARGQPVEGVAVHVDGEEVARTGAAGAARVERAGQAQLSLVDPRLQPVEPRTVPKETTEQLFEVSFVSREVMVEVRSAGGPVKAVILAVGPDTVEPLQVDGSGTVALVPGRWELLASADGLGVARRVVHVSASEDPEPVQFELREARLIVGARSITLKSVKFGLDEDVTGSKHRDLLEEVAATIIADPTILSVEVEGHTDSTGGSAYNFGLSRRRAVSVKRALVKLGVPPDLLTARGFGQTRPLASNGDEEGRAANRRVHFAITKEDGVRGGR